MMLAMSGSIEGDAGDGLRVINNSPLADLVGDAFSDWQAAGDLRTQLDLELELYLV